MVIFMLMRCNLCSSISNNHKVLAFSPQPFYTSLFTSFTTMPRILLLGHGAREHIIAERLAYSPQKPKLFAYMKAKNPGIADLAEDIKLGDYGDLTEIENFAKSVGITFAVIGPEEPLQKGVVDALEKIGIPSVGPKKELAKLETSKAFTRLLLKKYGIPGQPRFKVFESPDGISGFLSELDAVVIKPDGLTGGKGVKVQGDHFQTKEEALTYCKQVLETHPAVVVEEKLEGEEFSLQSFTDGKTLLHCPAVQDHKRAFAGDKGPNTGGMGSYSIEDHSLPFLSEVDIGQAKRITDLVREALFKETGSLYKGVMFGGFIAAKDGVKLLEYNARLGDPEAMNVLPILENDFVGLCQSIIDGTLQRIKPAFSRKATVCKYAVPKGYPSSPVKGEKIFLGDVPKDVKVYYGSVEKADHAFLMTGSRAVAFVGLGKTLREAEELAESGANAAKGPIFHREDIGTAGLIAKRVSHMQQLRS